MKVATAWRMSSTSSTEPSPQALLFEGPDEALGHAVALGFAHEGGVVLDAQPVEGTLEVVGPVLAAPVVAQLDSSGHVGSEPPEAVDDGVIDGLEGSEAVPHLGHMGPGLVGVVVDQDEDPDPAIGPRPGHGGVRSPAQVGGLGDDLAVMDPGTPALGRPLGSEQAGVAHEAQHPVLAHMELVFSAQTGPYLAVALAGKGALGDHPSDPLGELVVADEGLWTRSDPEGITSASPVIDG